VRSYLAWVANATLIRTILKLREMEAVLGKGYKKYIARRFPHIITQPSGSVAI
jgi:hypothetical protein